MSRVKDLHPLSPFALSRVCRDAPELLPSVGMATLDMWDSDRVVAAGPSDCGPGVIGTTKGGRSHHTIPAGMCAWIQASIADRESLLRRCKTGSNTETNSEAGHGLPVTPS